MHRFSLGKPACSTQEFPQLRYYLKTSPCIIMSCAFALDDNKILKIVLHLSDILAPGHRIFHQYWNIDSVLQKP